MVSKKTKIWISIVTAFTVIMAGVIAWINPFATTTVSAGQYRDGYLLIPEDYDLFGVSINSKFTLLTQSDHTLEDIVANFFIDGEPKPVIEKRSSTKFVITPVRPLEVNKLYTFRMQRKGYEDVTWSFQTGYPFGVVSGLPANQSTGVPVNTGIEFTFTHEGFQDLEAYFTITPNVKGKFERHGSTAVFVPEKELQYGTIYTVTLKAGLALENTNKTLQEDFVFSFETQPKNEKQSQQYQKGWFAFNRVLNEASSGEIPWIPVYYYIYNRYDNKTIEDLTVNTDVYSLGDVQSFIDTLKEKDKIPYWASYSVQNNLLPVSGLNRVITFQQVFPGQNKAEEDNYLRLPDQLPKGFYLINTKWEDLTFQTLLQVTDIGIYSVVTDKEALVWLNTVGSGAPAANAKIKSVDTSSVFTTDLTGVAVFDPVVLKKDKDQTIAYLQVTAGKDQAVIRFENTYRIYYDSYYRYYGGGQSEDYWSTFQLDRQLYKPTDTISFWGFLKERDADQTIPSEVTVEIGNQYYRPFFAKSSAIWPGYQGSALEKTVVKVSDGMYQGQIKIPNIQPGSYSITVKDKDVVLASSYINVEDYVKPAYTIEVTSDKKGVKNGDPVTFTFKAAFFEGTPVANLNINYNINFYSGNQYVESQVITDKDGVAKVSFIPDANPEVQGMQSLSVYARAQLPESGEISASHNVTVFVNDIYVQAQATLEKEQEKDQGEGKIKIQVNHVDLEKYNSSDENDYLGGPVKGKSIQGSVTWNTWERIEVGKYYDYINKVTYPRYDYKLRTQTVRTFTAETDAEGVATAGFTPLDEKDGYYTVSIQTQDQSGRTIRYDHIYVSGSTRSMGYYPYSYDYYYLEKEKDQYKPGETVALTYKFGEKALEGGKFLFVKAARGNLEWDILDSSKLEFTMTDTYAPNIYVYGVWFNNRVNIVSRQEMIQYDYRDKKIKLTAQTDKETYRPGDTVTVKLSAEKGPGAFINISLVDEALFALNDQYVNTLDRLYRSVSSGLVWEYRSHANSGRDVADGTAGEREESQSGGIVANDSKSLAPSFAATADQVAIREDFKDTALFKTIQLDENGKGIFSFTLPDNITQWRITLSGVTKDLKAGTDLQSLDVSLPFFISYNSSETFLAGDKPVLGVTGYGAELKSDDQIQITVKDKLTGATLATATGPAFQRINLQMPVLQTGRGEWIVEAVTTGGLKDGISHVYNTLESYHTMQKADYTDLTPYTVINGHNSRNLSLIFTDRTRGQWLPDIYSLSWTYGNRFEQKLGSRIARDLLVKYFDQEMIEDNSFKPKDYQVSDGGLGILPYAASDVFVTAWAAELVKDDVDIMRLKEYLYGRLETESAHASRIAALYGLASLKEPVMLELEKYASKDSLSTEEALYLVLAYQTLGEKPVALDLYNRLVAPQLDQYESYAKVKKNTYMKTQDDVTRNTVIAAVAAVRLNLPEAEKLMNYVRMNPTEESLINLQKISYVNEVIDRIPGGNSSIVYTWLGEEFTQEIGPGGSFTMNIPGAKTGDFKVKSIEGEIGLVTVYEVMRNESIKTDPGITVTRSYGSLSGQKGNMFKAGDIVEVTLNVTIGKDAMDNYYKLSDYLPAGLKAIETPMRSFYDAGDMKITHWYKDVDGQKVSFYIFPYKDKESFTYTYYARIASPGQYKAEAAVVQGVNVLDSTAVTTDQIIYIQP